LNSSQVISDELDVPLNLSKLKARDSHVELLGASINDSATTIDELTVRRGRLVVEDITVSSTSADLSNGTFDLSSGEININGLLTMWNANMWLGNSSTISASSYEGNDCDGQVYQIGGDDSKTVNITFPISP